MQTQTTNQPTTTPIGEAPSGGGTTSATNPTLEWLKQVVPLDNVLICDGEQPVASASVSLATDELIFIGDGKAGATFERATGKCVSGPKNFTLREPTR